MLAPPLHAPTRSALSAPLTLAIAGAGPVGLALALAAAQRHTQVHLIEKRAQFVSDDIRILTLANSSMNWLEQQLQPSGLGLRQLATPIRDIRITLRGHWARSGFSVSPDKALGWVIPHQTLCTQLLQAIEQQANIQIHWGCTVAPSTVMSDSDQAQLTLSLQTNDPATTPALRADLLCRAEGQIASEQMSSHIASRDYQSSALIASVSVSQPQADVAYECFTTAGPLALLPLPQGRYNLVWCNPQASRLAQLPAAQLQSELQAAFGWRLGRILQIDLHGVWPLRANWQKSLANLDEILIGNAAQTLHPVAGQGFNLGLRDIQELLHSIANSQLERQHTKDPLTTLRAWRRNLAQDYFARRAPDRFATLTLTDQLAQQLSTPLGRWLGAKVLNAMQSTPGVKPLIMQQFALGLRSS